MNIEDKMSNLTDDSSKPIIPIDVIIPIYNRHEMLYKALQSIENQTSIPTNVIIVDDSSSPAITLPSLNFTFSITLIRNNYNKGASSSRNIGVNASSEKYIAFLDSDDLWLTDKLEKQYKLAELSQADLVYCDHKIVSPTGQFYSSQKELYTQDILENLLDFWVPPNTSTLLFRRSAFLEIGGFDENLGTCEDHDLWFRVAQSNLKVNCVREPLSVFFHHSQERLSFNFDKRLSGIEKFLDNQKEIFLLTKGYKSLKIFSRKYYARVFLPLCTRSLKNRKFLLFVRSLSMIAFNPEAYKIAYAKLIKLITYRSSRA